MSEFYALRRTSIKDVTGFCAFVLGFFGSAPLAWPYLSSQAENGDFARGVGVFFLVIVTGAAISGAAGLVVGTGIGWTWERVHRFRRRRASIRGASARSADPTLGDGPPAGQAGSPDVASRELRLAGRTLDAITYRPAGLELAFGLTRLRAPLDLGVRIGDAVYNLPDPRARAVLHDLLGEMVQGVDDQGDGTVELRFANGTAIRRLSMTDSHPGAVLAAAD